MKAEYWYFQRNKTHVLFQTRLVSIDDGDLLLSGTVETICAVTTDTRSGFKRSFIYCAFQLHADSKIQTSTYKCIFSTVNLMFGCFSKLLTTAECAEVKSLSTLQTMKQCMAAVRSWVELPNIWLTAVKNALVSWTLNFRVYMSLRGVINLNKWRVKISENIDWKKSI